MSKIIHKPWGWEELWAHTDNYVGKRLFICSRNRLSLQYHEKKEETITVIRGTLILEIDGETRKLQCDESCHIPPGTKHRMCAGDNDVLLVEVSTPELDDIVRLEDDYGRK